MASLVIIDDDDAIRGWLGAVLRAARHTVRSFFTAEEALPAIRAELPDLVIADIRLPGMSGLELLAELRADPATAPLALILITSVGDRRTFRQGMELGADDFITKPLAVEEVTRAVDARLARSMAMMADESVRGLDDAGVSVPLRIGRFQIDRRLARGYGTELFLGRDANGAQAAIKVLVDATPQGGIDPHKRFVQEIEIAGAVSHPNLARVLDHGVDESRPYVAFEYFPMGDLGGLISTGIAPNMACRIVGQVAAGLSALHEAGIIHRDVKPSNVMVRSASSFALTDFGTAKRLRIDTTLTPHGQVVGTPAYVSPEQITRKPISPATDIYSLGMMFYELLSGAKAFSGPDYHQVLHAHLTQAPAALPERLRAFQPLVDRMVAKNPAARHGSAAEVIRDLDALGY
jgi:serine/threonine protein kinase